jgi:hypothetical protein
MYYQIPEENLPSVKLEDIDETILYDPVTADVINENINVISDVRPFTLSAVGLALNDMSEQDKRDARNEAKKVLGQWISRRNRKEKKRQEKVD